MKVAFIGNIYSKCGIATYNEQLYSALSPLCEVKFFAEKSENQVENINYCWDRNEFPKVALIDAVDEFKPDIVLFSHEYGLFPKSYYFSCLVSYFKLRGYKVVTVYHSVYELHKDKITSESVCKNIVVHTTEAKSALIRKGLNAENISVIPHGCKFLEKDKIVPNLWNHFGNNHVITQAGFLFYYKNHLEMLDVVSELKKKYPDIVYIIIGSENPKCQEEHNKVYEDISKKIEKLNLQHNVIIDRGFASDEVLMAYIRTSSVFVLPYKPGPDFDVFAASGMARLVISTSTPLVVSHANLFNGLDNTCLKANSLDEWVAAISSIFDAKYDRKKMVAEREKFIKNNSWSVAAIKLVEIFEKAK
jgi:glycosyltransferase involved in cell wall biosynthesis